VYDVRYDDDDDDDDEDDDDDDDDGDGDDDDDDASCNRYQEQIPSFLGKYQVFVTDTQKTSVLIWTYLIQQKGTFPLLISLLTDSLIQVT